jgi:hypothetical protein
MPLALIFVAVERWHQKERSKGWFQRLDEVWTVPAGIGLTAIFIDFLRSDRDAPTVLKLTYMAVICWQIGRVARFFWSKLSSRR